MPISKTVPDLIPWEHQVVDVGNGIKITPDEAGNLASRFPGLHLAMLRVAAAYYNTGKSQQEPASAEQVEAMTKANLRLWAEIREALSSVAPAPGAKAERRKDRNALALLMGEIERLRAIAAGPQGEHTQETHR